MAGYKCNFGVERLTSRTQETISSELLNQKKPKTFKDCTKRFRLAVGYQKTEVKRYQESPST